MAGEPVGHPFRGNQYIAGITNASNEEREQRLRDMKNLNWNEKKRLDGGVSGTYWFTDPDTGRKLVFKPASLEPDWFKGYADKGKQTEREIAAWELAKIVGMTDLVPPAIEKTIGTERGAAIEFQDAKVAAESRDPYGSAQDIMRIAAYDWVTGNGDRHQNNWMIAENGKVRLIDHGLAFVHVPDDQIPQSQFIGVAKAFNQELDLSPYQQHKDEIVAMMTRLGLSQRTIDGVVRRMGKQPENRALPMIIRRDAAARLRAEFGIASPPTRHPPAPAPGPMAVVAQQRVSMGGVPVVKAGPKEAAKLGRAALVLRKAVAQRGPATRAAVHEALARVERRLPTAQREKVHVKAAKEERRAARRNVAAGRALQRARAMHGPGTRGLIAAALKKFRREP